MSPTKCTKCSTLGSTQSLKQCSRCKSAIYCSEQCQRADWNSHKIQCSNSTRPMFPVRGVTIHCENDKRRGAGIFQITDLSPTHNIHTEGVLCPVSVKIGLPIIMYRHLRGDPLAAARDAGLDNQIATYLMVDPRSGFAPPWWQQGVGSVTVMRQDGRPLSYEAIEAIWMYHDHLLELFAGGGPPRGEVTRVGFDNFCHDYKKEKLTNGYNGFRSMPVPL